MQSVEVIGECQRSERSENGGLSEEIQAPARTPPHPQKGLEVPSPSPHRVMSPSPYRVGQQIAKQKVTGRFSRDMLGSRGR